MITTEMLAALKVDLGIATTAYDDRLTQYIESAMEFIEGEGATLDLTKYSHVQLVEMYAGWLWRKRDTGEGMPRAVRLALNNLIFHQNTEDE